MKASPILRGVNLGGWLVLEKWMTPSLFAGTTAIDHYTFIHTIGSAQKLTQHMASFITEADFVWLVEHGINAVRVPVGFWALCDTGSLTNVRRQLDWLFVMGEKYHIAILLCLHAAPGSQNGNDHSGRAGKLGWYTPRHLKQTYCALNKLAQRYSAQPSFWGLELLNEPKAPKVYHDIMLRIWTRRVSRRLHHAFTGIRLVCSDAFVPDKWSGQGTDVMDIHHYQAFSLADKQLSVAQHIEKVRNLAARLTRWQKEQPVIIGEWSLGLDSASLQGVDRTVAEREFGAIQLEVYEKVTGWFFWSYKTEHDDGWNFRALVEHGQLVLPTD